MSRECGLPTHVNETSRGYAVSEPRLSPSLILRSHTSTPRAGESPGTSYIGDLLLIQERRGWQVFLRCPGSQSLLLGEAHVA